MSSDQAKKETSAQASIRIAALEKAKLDAKKIQQRLERDARLANKHQGQITKLATSMMAEEALRAEIETLKLEALAKDVALGKFDTMQNEYFRQAGIIKDINKDNEKHALELIHAQTALKEREIEIQAKNVELARINYDTLKLKTENPSVVVASTSDHPKARARLGVGQPFFSGRQSDTNTIRNWIRTTEVNIRTSRVESEYAAYEAGTFLRDVLFFMI